MGRLENLLIQGRYTPVPRQLAKAVNVILFVGLVTVMTPQGLPVQRRLTASEPAMNAATVKPIINYGHFLAGD